jgi:hypothetical protein
MLTHVPKLDKPVDRAQQVIRWNVILNAELVEQSSLSNLLRSHHRQISLATEELNQGSTLRSSSVFQQNPDQAVILKVDFRSQRYSRSLCSALA